MNKALSNTVIWFLVAGYFLWVLADSFFHPAATGVSATVNVFFVIAIVTLHGLRRYSLKEFLIFFVIAFIVSNFYENLSILTGFPFGHYHYTDALGPKLFLVPLLIAPAYFGCGYLAWSLAHVFVGVFGSKLRAEQIWRVPLVAAFVMVMWDLTMDPIAATVQKQWIWHDGGSYFGVPFVNYLGWLLCVYTIFQLFAIYISRQIVASEQAEPSWYDRSSVLVSSCGRIRDYGSYLGATRADRWECRDHRRNRPAVAGHADLPKHGTDRDLHDGVCGASQRSSDR